ncbi:DUF4352 domain-containing protein [Candidatus Woesearchaeota archaeon]|nr:DUF4352 domain-containing protein [Candidatus Woesearchaeota archaeon]
MKKLLIILLVLVVLIISGCGDVEVTGDAVPNTGTVIQEEKPKFRDDVYSMNEAIRAGHLTYKATKVETFAKMGTSIFEKETDGKFVKIYLSITNKAKETKEMLTPGFKLIDSQDRKFDRFLEDMMHIADYLEFGKQLQPGLEESGAIIFEVPKDSKGLKLEIRGDWLSTAKITIDLSDIRDIGADTTQKERMEDIAEDMEEGGYTIEDMIIKCRSPFKCSSNCVQDSDIGRKDCPSGHLCCMTEKNETDQQMGDKMKQIGELLRELGLE